MPVVTVRGLPEEIPTIPEAAVRPRTRVRIGAELAAFGAAFGGLDLDLARNPDPAEPPPLWPGLTRLTEPLEPPFLAAGVPVLDPWAAR